MLSVVGRHLLALVSADADQSEQANTAAATISDPRIGSPSLVAEFFAIIEEAAAWLGGGLGLGSRFWFGRWQGRQRRTRRGLLDRARDLRGRRGTRWRGWIVVKVRGQCLQNR